MPTQPASPATKTYNVVRRMTPVLSNTCPSYQRFQWVEAGLVGVIPRGEGHHGGHAMDSKNLEERFDAAMFLLYERQCEVIRRPLRFRGMLGNFGGLGTAIRLLDNPMPGDGFVELWEAGRPDLSMEAFILEEPWRSLFTDEQLAVAQSRLER